MPAINDRRPPRPIRVHVRVAPASRRGLRSGRRRDGVGGKALGAAGQGLIRFSEYLGDKSSDDEVELVEPAKADKNGQ